MIISWPKAKKNQRREELVSTLDLFPTICEIAGLKVPNSLMGQSLKNIIHGKKPEWRRTMFTGYHVHSNHNPWPQRAVRDERYKLIFNPLSGEVNPGYEFTMSKKFMETTESELMESASDQVRAAYEISKKPPRFELYDLQKDPYEFNNLVNEPEHSGELKRLRSLLMHWQKESRDPFLYPETPEKLFHMIKKSGTKERKKIDYKSLFRKSKQSIE